MIDESQKRQILTEILESPEFKESKRYHDLLKYLVEETLAGRAPKEITVGIQFFGKDPSFDPKEDPTVRVYLNNLRKKLEHYYLTSEKLHPYRLTVPRGHYQVDFEKATEKPIVPEKSRLPFYFIGGLVVVSALLIGYFVRGALTAPEVPESVQSPIWKEFVTPNGRPTLVVLGDFFFLYERTADGKPGNFVRDLKINTPEDFRQIVKHDPGFSKRYVQSDFTFLRPSATWGLGQILPVLQHSPNGYSLKLASRFSVDDLKSNNVVFIGSFKTLYGLQKYLHIFGLEYTITPASFRIKENPGDSLRVFMPSEIKGGNYEKDFAVVAKGGGPEGSTILLLLGFADTGVIEAARASTDPRMLEAIKSKLEHATFADPFFFTTVVETEGINQAIFKSEIRHFVQRSLQSHIVTSMQSDTSNSR
ncbi:MAG: hypothetical protein NTZ35_07765 [Ignavibacteriales bacterium]|nr:hypothetical protein [Ignavibacteriales bacterium]